MCPQKVSQRSQGAESSGSAAQWSRRSAAVHSFQPAPSQSQQRPGGSQTVGQPPRQQARVFALTEEQAQETPDDVVAGSCSLCGYPAYVLIDTGASHTFISEQFALMHSLPIESLSVVVSVSSPLGTGLISMNSIKHCMLQYDGH